MRNLYGAGLRDRHAVPGMVVSIQTYGDQAANWQPHLHALVTAGVVDGAGAFPSTSAAEAGPSGKGNGRAGEGAARPSGA